MNNLLTNKKVLLICPKFFNYHIEIKNIIMELGMDVDWFDERPSNDNITRALIRINKKILSNQIEKYYKKIYSTIENKKYEYMLIVKPEAISSEFILKFKKNNPNAKVIMYLWDSIKNNKNAKRNLKLVDKAFSFDKEDCSMYNMNFRPLFYLKKYEDIANCKAIEKYSVAFIGTVHSDRYDVLMKVKEKLIKEGYSVYFYMYIQSKFIYYLKKLVFREFKNSSVDEFNFTPLTQNEVIDLIKQSKCILDIQHLRQTGLTMRTLEMLGANKKLITTNREVINYDFYNEKNINIVNRDISDFDSNFIEEDYELIDLDIKEKYSLKSWALDIFNNI